MKKNELYLRKVVVIAICLSVSAVFWNCEKSSENLISIFKIIHPPAVGKIDELGKTIKVELPAGTDVTALVPEIVCSPKATVNPQSGAPQDFTSPVPYFVTAQNGSTAKYTVTINFDGDIIGTWKRNPPDCEITFSDNIGVFTQFHSGIWLTLYQEGKLNIGDQKYKDITKTGNLTWSCQELFYSPSDDKFSWGRCEFTLNKTGDMLTVINNFTSYTLTKINK